MQYSTKIYIISSTLFMLLTQTAMGSGCNTVVPKQIHFEKGSSCWNFKGKANTFIGNFSGNQLISVDMESEDSLSPHVTGPGEFFAGDNKFSGGFAFTTPRSGQYKFSYSPCSMWYSLVRVSICAYKR